MTPRISSPIHCDARKGWTAQPIRSDRAAAAAHATPPSTTSKTRRAFSSWCPRGRPVSTIPADRVEDTAQWDWATGAPSHPGSAQIPPALWPARRGSWTWSRGVRGNGASPRTRQSCSTDTELWRWISACRWLFSFARRRKLDAESQWQRKWTQTRAPDPGTAVRWPPPRTARSRPSTALYTRAFSRGFHGGPKSWSPRRPPRCAVRPGSLAVLRKKKKTKKRKNFN